MGFSFRARQQQLTVIVNQASRKPPWPPMQPWSRCAPIPTTTRPQGAGREARRRARAAEQRAPQQPPVASPRSPRASNRSGRPSWRATQRRREVRAPALAALDPVRAAAARADRRRLLVRHRRPGDVDRQRLCPGRQGRRLDRRLRHRQGGRGPREPARRGRARCCSASTICRSGSRSSAPTAQLGDGAQRPQRAEGELPGHAGADRAGAGRHRLLRSRIPAPAGPRGQERRVAGRPSTRARGTCRTRNRSSPRSTSSSPRIAAKLGGDPDIAGRAAPALPRCHGAARRGRAPARPHGGEGAVRRHRDQRALAAARQVSAGLDDRLLSGRHGPRLGRGQPEGDRADLCAARPAGHGHGRHLSGRGMARHGREHQPGGGAASSRCCRRRTRAATGSRSCSASRCACASTPATRRCRRCAPA